MSTPILEMSHIDVTFNAGTASEVQALRDLSLTVNLGEFVTVIGANGAGKSTLFNAIAGSAAVEGGSIHLDGRDITDWAEHRRSDRIARVFQNPLMGTCPGLSVLENLSLAYMRGKRHGLRRGVKRSEREMFRHRLRALNMGLESRLDADVSLLSGGQRQAVTLLMATINHPDLLLLDEHTAALDPNAAHEIIDLTVQFVEQEDLTVLMITHSMSQACAIGDRVLMMNRGQFLFEVSGDERANLTVDDLIQRFRSLQSEDSLSDRTLLE